MKMNKKTVIFVAFVCVVKVCLGAEDKARALTPDGVRDFERHYAAWKEDANRVGGSSKLNDYLTTNYWLIVEMGPKILPLINEKIETDRDFPFPLGLAWATITRLSGIPSTHPWVGDASWGKGGQELGNIRSKSIIAKIKDARKIGDKESEQKHWRTLSSLGLFSLPTLFGELKEGDEAALMPIKRILFKEIKAETIKEDASASDLLNWWAKNKDEYKLPPGEEDFFKQKTIEELTMPVPFPKPLQVETLQK